MKTLIVLFLVALLAAIVGYSAWTRVGIKGDGVIKTEERAVSEFSKIAVAGGYEIQWSHGKPALTISTDENLLPHIRTQISDGTLQIDSKENLRPSKNTMITISSESMVDVQLTGANTFQAGPLSGPDLQLASTGASTINVDGSVAKLVANLTGASTLHATSLQTQTASLTLTGASNAWMCPSPKPSRRRSPAQGPWTIPATQNRWTKISPERAASGIDSNVVWPIDAPPRAWPSSKNWIRSNEWRRTAGQLFHAVQDCPLTNHDARP